MLRYSFSTTLHQFRNRPLARFNARSHCRGASNRQMRLAKVVIREIQRRRSFKIVQLFAESVGQPGQPPAVHPQRVVLFLHMAGANPADVRHSGDDRLFRFHHLRWAVPAGRVFIEIHHGSDFHVHLNSDNKQLCDEIFWDLFIARIITPLSSAECLKGRFCRHSDAQANREKLARDQGLSLDT